MSDSQPEVGSVEQAGGDDGKEQEAKDEGPASDLEDAAQDETSNAPAEDEDDHEESAVNQEHASEADLDQGVVKEDDAVIKGEENDEVEGGGSGEEIRTEVGEGEGNGDGGEIGDDKEMVSETKEEEEGHTGKGEGEEGVVGEESGDEEVAEKRETVSEAGEESAQERGEKKSEEEDQQMKVSEETAEQEEGEVNEANKVEAHESNMTSIQEGEELDEGEAPAMDPEDPVEPAHFVLRQPPEDDFNLEPEFDENEMYFGNHGESAQSFLFPARDPKDGADDEEEDAAVQVKALSSMDREQYYELCRVQHAVHAGLRRRNAVLQKKMMLHYKRHKSKDVFRQEEASAAMEERYARKLTQFGEAQTEDAAARRLAADAIQALEATNAHLADELADLLNAFVCHERDTCAGTVSHKSGKPLSDRDMERLLRRQRDAVDAMGATRLAYIKRGDRVRALEAGILALEDLGQNLKIVDYEQLRMENQNLVEKIEERDEELSRFRGRALHSVEALSHFRQKAVGVNDAVERHADKLRRGQDALDTARTELNSLKAARDRLRADYVRDSAQCGLLTKPQLLRDFEVTLDECDVLRAQLRTLRIEIAHEQRQLEAIRALGPAPHHEIERRTTFMDRVKLRAQHRRAQHEVTKRPAQREDGELCETFAFA